jgi:hypothetical protein
LRKQSSGFFARFFRFNLRSVSSATRLNGGQIMLWTIAVLLLILWLLGMVSSYTLGGFIHILLVLAIIVVLIRVIQGRSPVA